MAGRDAAARDLQAAMVETVDEVGRVAAAEGIDCGYAKGGTLTLAPRPRTQATGPRARSTDDHDWGLAQDTCGCSSPAEARERIGAAGVLGATFTPHCARVQPARLVRGLARVVEARGVTVYERTAATAMRPGRGARPTGATVRAPVVVRATEGYTPQLPGQRRAVLPIYSLIVATAPLPAAAWAELGWGGRETLTDGRHLLIYAQRTADGRIAFGGRGAPYHFGSPTEPAYDRDERVFAELERTLRALLPAIGDVPVTHRWGGPLGAPRDWFPSVGLDRGTGLAWAGGYVGDGVGDRQPGRPHAGRPDPAPGHRADPAALGRPPVPALGAGAAALARRDRGPPAGDVGRRRRVPHRHPVPRRAALLALHRRLSPAGGGGGPPLSAAQAVRSAAAAANASVCRSTSASVVAGRHQRHVVERREQDAAVQRVEVEEPLELEVVGRRGASLPLRGGSAREPCTRPGSRAGCTCHGSPSHVDARRATPSAQRVGRAAIIRANASSVSTSLERRPHRGQRQRVAGQRAADAADVDVLQLDRAPAIAVGDARRSCRTRRIGMPPPIALPIVEHVRLESVRAACSRPGRRRACASRR